MPRSSRPVRALVAVTGAALLATSCTSGDDGDEPSGDDVARWSAVDLPSEVSSANTGVAFANLLPAVEAQPPLLVGVERVREEPPLARAWQGEGELWRPIDLPVEGEDAEDVGTAFAAGTATWVAGTTWTADDGVRPYAISSADRSTWEQVELPAAAAERAFSAQAGAAAGDGVVLLGSDGERAPVAVVPGGELTDLPAPPDGAEFRGFAQAAMRGGVVVAVGSAAAPGQPGQHVVYRSGDAGSTWTVANGPAVGPAGLSGVAASDAGFLVTGSLNGPNNRAQPRAWWSTDGTAWQAESLPPDVLGELDPLDEYYLGPPASGGGRVVATLTDDGSLGSQVVQRDDAGRWTRQGVVVDWDLPGVSPLPAVQPDGTVLLAQSARNGGRISQLSGGVASSMATFGRIDDGLGWSGFLAGAEPPVLLGERVQVDVEPGGGWSQTSPVSRYALTGSGTVEPAPWDPPDSEGVDDLATARGPDGSQVLMGVRVSGAGDDTRANVVGWHRAGPDAPWTPVQGLETRETELLEDVARDAGTLNAWTTAECDQRRRRSDQRGAPAGTRSGPGRTVPARHRRHGRARGGTDRSGEPRGVRTDPALARGAAAGAHQDVCHACGAHGDSDMREPKAPLRPLVKRRPPA